MLKILRGVLLAILVVGSMANGTLAQSPAENVSDIIRRGNEHYANANYELAIKEYRRVPNDGRKIYAQALYNIGVCYYELWQTEQAIAYYQKAIEVSQGRYPAALHALGVALKDLGRMPEARKAFEQSLVASEGSYVPTHYVLGLLAMGQGNHEGALSRFQQAIAGFKGGRFPAAHNNLGVVLARMNRLPEAKLEFEIAISQADGKFNEATENLRLCNFLLAIPPKTIAALKAVEGPTR